MSGLRFESMADMPPRMRELYARQALPEEQTRRKALPLTEDENGVRRKHVGTINEANSREN